MLRHCYEKERRWLPDILFRFRDFRDISIRGSRFDCIRIVTDFVPSCKIELTECVFVGDSSQQMPQCP